MTTGERDAEGAAGGKRITRRTMLGSVGTAGAAGLAGCSFGSSGGSSPPPGGSGSSGGSAGRGTPQPTATATPTPCPGEDLGGRITEDLTLGEDCEHYRVVDALVVESDATLTVRPGVRLTFADGVGLTVTDGGQLLAEGEADAPIVFTGEREERGAWRGIYVASPGTGAESRLTHAVVEYGGSREYARDAANVTVASRRDEGEPADAAVSLESVTLRESAGLGLALSGAGIDLALEESVLTGNALGPAGLSAAIAHRLGGSSTYRGNDRDYVRVDAARLDAADDRRWAGLDAPYLVDGTITVAGGVLRVGPGGTLVFGEGGGVRTTRDGAFAAEGDADDQVRLTARDEGPGGWRGVYFATEREENRLGHAVVEYGGARPWLDEPANVTVGKGENTEDRDVLVADSTVRDGAGHGVHVVGHAVVEFRENRIAGHEAAAAHVPPRAAHYFDAASEYAGNGTDALVVTGGHQRDPIRRPWAALDVPYLIEEAVAIYEGITEIEPGARLQFRQGAGIFVRERAALRAVGTADDPVRFSAADGTPGGWAGLYFTSATPDNQLVHAVVEHGGGDERPNGWPDVRATVSVSEADGEDARELRLVDTDVVDGAGYGVHFLLDVAAEVARCRFAGNAAGPVHVPATTVHQFDASSQYAGNGRDAFHVTGTRLSDPPAVTWRTLDVPYLIEGTVSLFESELTVEEGAELIFRADSGLTVWRTGGLTVDGSEEAPVRLVGEHEAPGSWHGIFLRNADAVMNNVEIRHGGGTTHPFADGAGAVTLVHDGGNGPAPTLTADGIEVFDYQGVAFYLGSNVNTMLDRTDVGGTPSNTKPGDSWTAHDAHSAYPPSHEKHHS